MDGHSRFGPVTVLLLAALTSSALGQSLLYFEEGKPLVLTPPKQGSVITSVEWTHNTEPGAPRKATRGDYKVEINNQQLSQVYTVRVIKRVPKPSVVVRTPSCGPTSSHCNFTCQGDPDGTQPLTYSWKKDSGEWEPEQQSMDLFLNDAKTKHVKQISCRMKNLSAKRRATVLITQCTRRTRGLQAGWLQLSSS
ncbi:unnamed protein product [Pleuronectes platessa]|uniref:Ig-like domain-containing protein n=1 Tax=Pleuronectes platessa TaxID=8262 RepID=A0A9N7V486_PLEPL|nr:unnamed protein product [Pleuronectes platessa]